MTRRLKRRRGDLEADRGDAPPPPRDSAVDLLELQRSAGNAAVSRLLQREAALPTLTQPTNKWVPPLGSGSLTLDPSFVEKRQKEVTAKIVAYLEQEKARIQGRIFVEGFSMPEVVDLVRQSVPEALELAPVQIERIVRESYKDITIPAHRMPGDVKGAESELVATVRNALGRIPTSVGVERKHGWFKVSVTGTAEAGVRYGGVSVSGEAQAGTKGVSSVGLNAAVGPVKFAAKLEPAKEDQPVKWEMQLGVPEADSMVPIFGKLGDVFGSANRSVGEIASEMRAENPSAAVIKKKIEPVKEAMGALSAIAGAKGPTVGIKVEGEGPEIKVQATLTIPF